MPDVSLYITTAEAAKRSGLSQETIAHYLKEHKRGSKTTPPRLRGIKVAERLWLVEIASLEEYLGTEHKRGVKAKVPNKQK